MTAATPPGESSAAEPTEPSPPGEAPPAAPTPGFGAFGSGLLSVLFVAGLVLLPVVGLVVAPLGLIPVAQYQAARGPAVRAWGWAAAALAVALSLAPSAPLTVVLGAYLLLVVIPSLGLTLWARSGWSEGRWAALTTAAGALYALLAVAALVAPAGPVEGTALALRQALTEVEAQSPLAGLPRADVDLWLDRFEQALSWLLPSVLVAYLVAVLFWVRPRLPVLGFRLAAGPFERYASEEWLPAAFAVAGAATLLLRGTPRWVAANLLAAVLILYFVHGLAIIRAHLARWLGRGWLVRWGVGLLSLQLPLPLFVAALGLVDSFFALRPPANDNGRLA